MRLLLVVLGCALLWAEEPDVFKRPRQAERVHDYDVQHYRIQLRFEEKTRSFFGETTITLDPLRDGFAECDLDADTFRVTAVRAQDGSRLRFEHVAPRLRILFPKPLHYKERVTFTVVYEAHNARVDPVKYGMAKDYDLGLDFKPGLINTLSFPDGAHHWFPCYDYPNDKATSEVIATVPDTYEAISNGRLVSTTADSAHHERTFRWLQEKPHSTYLFVLVAGRYVAVEDSAGELPVRFWVNAKDVPNAQRTFGGAREMIRFFESKLGVAYPWAKYDQIAIPGIGGGAESTSATVEGESLIHDGKAEKDFPSHMVVSHEIAHQWWGDLITMRDWSQTWLNESFASYYEYVYSKHRLGSDEGTWNLEQKRQMYLNEVASKYKRPIVWDRWEYPNQNFDRHTYQKGAAVLHMLAWVMGEENFDRAMTHFLRKHAYQSVDTHDLQVAIRESTGQDLDWFFDEWIFKAGHPVFTVKSEWSRERGKVTLRIDQKQWVYEWVPLFQTPVDIGITTAKGKRVERIRVAKEHDVIELDCPDEPLLVRFDEGNHLLMQLDFTKGTKELLYQLEHDDVLGRIRAAGALHNTPEAREALRRAAAADPFREVRRTALAAFAAVTRLGDVEFLKSRSADPDSLVRAAALRMLAVTGDRTLAPYFEERYHKEDSYLVQAEAVRALGRCGGPQSLAFLREVKGTQSPRNVIALAAADALKRLGG